MPDIKVDLSKAIVFEALPAGGPYLATISKIVPGESKEGNPKVHVEFTILEPEQWARKKVFDEINLVNENTQGRLLQILLAAGEDEKAVKSKNYTLKTEEIEGRQLTMWTRTRKGDNVNPDQAQWRKLALASVYTEASEF